MWQDLSGTIHILYLTLYELNTWRYSIFYPFIYYYVPVVVIFHLRRPIAFLSLSLSRYARTSSAYKCFILRARRLSSEATQTGIPRGTLEIVISGNFMVYTGIFSSNMKSTSHDCQMTVWHDDHSYSDFLNRSGLSSNLMTITDLDLISEFDLLPNYAVASMEHLQQMWHASRGTLTPPDTWSCPTLGLACVLMSRPISPELVLSPDLWISNTLWYFSRCFASALKLNTNPFVSAWLVTPAMIVCDTTNTYTWILDFQFGWELALYASAIITNNVDKVLVVCIDLNGWTIHLRWTSTWTSFSPLSLC